MTRSPDSLIPSVAEQSAAEEQDDKALTCRQEGEANLRAAPEPPLTTDHKNEVPPFVPILCL